MNLDDEDLAAIRALVREEIKAELDEREKKLRQGPGRRRTREDHIATQKRVQKLLAKNRAAELNAKNRGEK